MPGPWDVVGTSPAKKAGEWDVVDAKPIDAPSRPAGLPAGMALPGVKSAPLPGGITGRAGESPDAVTRLLGSPDGADVLKAIPRHVRDAALGLGSAALHPINAAKSAIIDPIANAPSAIRSAKTSGDVVNALSDAIPVVGPWARGVENDAREHGALPALMGLGTDVAAGEVSGRLGKAALNGASTAVRLAGTDMPSAKLAATRALVPGSTGEVLQRALKPGVKYGAAVDDTLAQALPDAIKANGKIGGVSDLGSALDVAKESNAAEHAATMAPYRSGSSPLRINGNETMAAQRASLPKLAEFERIEPNPITTSADSPYNKWLPAAEADELRQGANQKLSAFYSDANGNQHGALANPETARIKALGDNIREQLYPAIEADQNLSPGSISSRQQQYGRLSEAADIANKRDVVFGRHDPVSLSEKLVLGGHGGGLTSRVYDFALQKMARGLTDSDALVRSAVDRQINPSGTPLNGGRLSGTVSRGLRVSGEGLRRLSPIAPVFVRRSSADSE